MKNFLSILIICFITMGISMITSFAEIIPRVVYYDFSSAPDNSAMKLYESTGNTIAYSGGNMVLTRTANTALYASLIGTNIIGGKFLTADRDNKVLIVETKVKSSASGYYIYLQNHIQGGSILRITRSTLGALQIQTASIQDQTTTITTNYLTSGYDNSIWYTFKFVLNFDTKMVDTYIDEGNGFNKVVYNTNGGRFMANGTTINTLTEFSSIIYQHNATTDVNTSVHVDYLKMYYADDMSSAMMTKESLYLGDISQVESDLALPMDADNDSVILWESSDENIISVNGTVTRPTYTQGDKTVILTAKIYKNEALQTKTFSVNVKALPISDSEAIALDKEIISLPTIIKASFNLPSIGQNGTSILWECSDKSGIVTIGNKTGDVFPVTLNQTNIDELVTFTATIKKGNETDTKIISTTIQRLLTDAICVEEDLIELSFNSVYEENFNLPLFGANGSIISWKADNEEVIKINGGIAEVNRLTVDTTVTLTATATKGSATATKQIQIIVAKDIDANRELLTQAIASLDLGNLNGISSNISLPTTGINNTIIEWSSSDNSIIKNTGEIIRPNGSDKFVNLIATVKKGILSEQKTFSVKVLGIQQSGSGKSSTGGSTFTMPTPKSDETKLLPIEAPQKFTDVKKEHWAYEYIQKLSGTGIINGVTETEFAPDNYIKREEFVKLIMQTLEMNDKNATIKFDDVKKDDWYYSFVATAYKKGIINGISETLFGVGENMTREQMALIIYRAFEYKKTDSIDKFIDDNEISEYAKEAVYALKEKNVINGINQKFIPKNFATRAETAKILYLLKNQ